MMETKSLKLKFLVTVVIIYLISTVAKADNCCTYPSLQSEYVSDQFHTEEAYDQNGSCPPDFCVTPDETSRVEDVSFDIIYDARCQRNGDLGEDCAQRERSSYIALNISYKIAFTKGSHIKGIIFGLKNLDKEDHKSITIGTMDKICHYIYFNGTFGREGMEGRVFHYNGFVGLHPGSSYRLTTTLMCTNGSNDQDISIPKCSHDRKDMEIYKDDYFCNISTPASFIPKVGFRQNFSAWWIVWPEENIFKSYVIKLWTSPKGIEPLKVETIDDKDAQYNGTHRFITYQFLAQPPGSYIVSFYGQPDNVCSEDPHWKLNMCIEAQTTVDTTHVASTSQTSTFADGQSPTGNEINIELTLLVIILGVISLVLVGFPMIWLIKYYNSFDNSFDCEDSPSVISDETASPEVLTDIHIELHHPLVKLQDLSIEKQDNTTQSLLRSM